MARLCSGGLGVEGHGFRYTHSWPAGGPNTKHISFTCVKADEGLVDALQDAYRVYEWREGRTLENVWQVGDYVSATLYESSLAWADRYAATWAIDGSTLWAEPFTAATRVEEVDYLGDAMDIGNGYQLAIEGNPHFSLNHGEDAEKSRYCSGGGYPD
jgi:hypothetical protein